MVVEERLADLEGGVAAVAVASGQAASTLALLNIARAGVHIVSAASVYGGTYNLFAYTFADLGISVDFARDPDDLGEWRAAIRPNTKACYAETVGNPRGNVLDIAGVADVAHAAGVDHDAITAFGALPFGEHVPLVQHRDADRDQPGLARLFPHTPCQGGRRNSAARRDRRFREVGAFRRRPRPPHPGATGSSTRHIAPRSHSIAFPLTCEKSSSGADAKASSSSAGTRAMPGRDLSDSGTTGGSPNQGCSGGRYRRRNRAGAGGTNRIAGCR